MSVEIEDLALLKKCRQSSPSGDSCAVLGDCRFAMGIDSFKKEMAFKTVDTFDINGSPTYKVNLNEALKSEFHGKYNWVIDSGTLYCCFDINTVWENMLNLLTASGSIAHTGNLSGFFGRGFYSLSPALFRDFYNANNFAINCTASKTRQSLAWKTFNPNHTYLASPDFSFGLSDSNYTPSIPNDSMIFCHATREFPSKFEKPTPQHFIDTDGR
jgi:hypothetical protein